MRAFAPTVRALGRTFDRLGVSLQGDGAYVERLVPSVRKVAVKSTPPSLADSARLAPNASLIGKVSVGDASTVWYNSVVRADGNEVSIGASVTVGDGATVLSSAQSPTKVGDSVTIGPGATVSGCNIGAKAIVGAGAVVQAGSIVGENAIVAPGSIVAQGTTVGAGEVWAGAPAVKVRDVSLAESQLHSALAGNAREMADAHGAEWDKTPQQLAQEEIAHEIDELRDPDFAQFDDSSEIETDRRGILFNQLR